MEFTTAVRHGMDITHVLLNNGQLGKITNEQRAAGLQVWQTDLVNPSFAAFARLCGGKGTKVTEAAELDVALAEAMDYDGPALIEIVSDPELV
jgi:thiamine pyrophosphate-dependent acetolactate synthase large subunit-like protein